MPHRVSSPLRLPLADQSSARCHKIGIMPAAVAPEHPAGDPFVPIAAFLVDSLHRRVHRVALDSMQPQLAEGELGPDPNRVSRIAPAPGDRSPITRPPVAQRFRQLIPCKPMKPMCRCLVDDRPDEIRLALVSICRRKLFLAAGDAQVELDRRRDLGVVQPDQGVFEVQRPVGRNKPNTFALQPDDRHLHPPLSRSSGVRFIIFKLLLTWLTAKIR